jgi:hypothetical protein
MTRDYLADYDRVVMKRCEEYRRTQKGTLNNIALGRVSSSSDGGYVAQKPITVKDLTALLKSRNQYDDVKRQASTNGLSVGHYLEQATTALNNNFVTLANLMNAPNVLAALSSASSSASSSTAYASSSASSASSSSSSVSSYFSGLSHPYSDDETGSFEPDVLLSPLQRLTLTDAQHSNQPSTSYQPFTSFSTPTRPGHIGNDLQAQGGRGRPILIDLPQDIRLTLGMSPETQAQRGGLYTIREER